MREPARRIVSFLPSATEMVYALELEERLLGVTHECDWPPAAQFKPVVVRSVLPVEQMSQREIDDAVSLRMKNGESLYQVDEAMMRDIAPDLILTQSLCQVCAPSGNEVTRLLASLNDKPDVLYLTPRTIEEVFGNVRELGATTGRGDAAEEFIASCRARLDRIEAKTRDVARPRVFCMEWLDPIYCCGHWVPEMVRIAGGQDAIGREGSESVRVSWQEVREFAPDVLVVMPCGFHLQDVVKQATMLANWPGLQDIPAVRNGRVFAVDASSYFARPGPRIVEGTELLAHLIHPELFGWAGPEDAFAPLNLRTANAQRGGRIMSERVWPKEVRTRTCPRCGQPLTCGPAPGQDHCWCDARPHVALTKVFGDCLCPKCLDDEIAQAERTGVSN